MRAYLAITGTLFALITLAHILRMMAEGPRVATDPWFASFTVISAALCLWAWRLFRRPGRTDQSR